MQEQTRNILIGAVVAILVLGALFYYKKAHSPAPAEDTSPNITETPTTPTENSSPAQATPSQTTVNATQNTAKFNTAMDNARTAFRNKDYSQAVIYYKQALTYENTDTPYSGLYYVYAAEGNWVRARAALDSAIKINPRFFDYWNSKLTLLDQYTTSTYQELKNVYNEGLSRVDPAYKINLVTHFAQIAESNGQIAEAISLWSYAKTLFPANSSIYQAEIDRLQKN